MRQHTKSDGSGIVHSYSDFSVANILVLLWFKYKHHTRIRTGYGDMSFSNKFHEMEEKVKNTVS